MKRWLTVFASLCVWTLVLGAGKCDIPWPIPTPTPTATPTPEPTPVPTPTPACSIDGEPGAPVPDYKPKPQIQEAVFAAIKRLRPDCDTGGTCLLGDVTRKQWHAALIAEVRKGGAYGTKQIPGICAGEHIPGVTDEIAVALGDREAREGWKVFAGDDTDGPVPPGGIRRTVAWKYTGAYAAPGEEPPPVEPPPPAGDGCGEPAPPPAAKINVKVHNAFCANLDSTILVQDAAYCASVGFLDRKQCPVRQEGAADRAACEGRLRGPAQRWSCDGADCQVYPCAVAGNCECAAHKNTNPAQAIVMGKGTVTTCTSDGKACGSVVIQ